jgi:hydroxymethylpyrimidine pyrophosphatase-like HAD family hydrolase
MVATDVDDTMTRHRVLTPAVLTAIERLVAAGIEVLPVSGRAAGEMLGLARYLPGVRRALAENGATLLMPDREPGFLRGAPDRDRVLLAAAELSQGLQAPLELTADAFCRIGDVAFERAGRTNAELQELIEPARRKGLHLVWSSVHVHLSPSPPDKGAAVLQLCQQDGVAAAHVATIGDSPNDVGLWVPGRFGVQVGTAAVLRQTSVLRHEPTYVAGEGADGWVELADRLLAARA